MRDFRATPLDNSHAPEAVESQLGRGVRDRCGKHLKLGGQETSRALFLELEGHFLKIKRNTSWFIQKSCRTRALIAPTSYAQEGVRVIFTTGPSVQVPDRRLGKIPDRGPNRSLVGSKILIKNDEKLRNLVCAPNYLMACLMCAAEQHTDL